jgi:hypothetical protein
MNEKPICDERCEQLETDYDPCGTQRGAVSGQEALFF